ncbi:MAG: ATP-binding protein [Desulfuromonadales bacterium]
MKRSDLIRLAVLTVLIVAITALHYMTTTEKHQFHDIYRRLYYLPIILGGFWFSLRGGIAVSIIVSILYAPHVVFQWGHHPTTQTEQFLEILLYNIIGFMTGFLSERERRQRNRYQAAAERLEESYDKLKKQADMILEIEEQLRRADRLSALGELSAGMAHEIGNPLGSIKGTAEILRDAFPAEDKRHEFSEILIREADRLNKVVHDFLTFARPSPVGAGRYEVNEVLRDVLLLTRQQAKKNGVEIILNEDPVPAVVGDREQIKQAFLNLILNAVQAMPQGGLLTISSARSDGRAEIRFVDTGQGISAENLDRIFNPFFTTRHEGTGLGLAITHRIVQSHGGGLEVNSRVGKGTEFILTLPLAREEFQGDES